MTEGYYKDDNDCWRKNIFMIPFKGASDGGTWSTTGDLLKFINAINNNKLLTPEYTDLFLRPEIFDYQSENLLWKYGYGNWFLISNKNNKIIRWGHPGEDTGVSTRLFYYPDTNTTIIILSNISEVAGPISWFIHKNLTFK